MRVSTKLVAALLGGLLFASAGCGGAPEVAPLPAAQPAAEAAFLRSPGGTLEVAPEVVARARSAGARLRLIDVRDEAELHDDLGHIEGVEHVPLGALAEVAAGWDPEERVVLVCRSGRRSARGAEELEALGFRHVASMTGGMLRWRELGLPAARGVSDVREIPRASAPRDASVRVEGRAGAPPLVVDPAEVRWVRTASLLGGGSEACVDGRGPRAVIGTPGGDAGELLVAAATVESFGVIPSDARGTAATVDAWIDAFGRFYVHTDEHALEHLRHAVLADPRFVEAGVRPNDPADTEALVRHPPHALEGALLELLVQPENVGCGHLRAMLTSPDEYRVRPGLTADVLRAVFRHLWRAPHEVEWEVLAGEHHERAVAVVHVAGEVHPYTRVPAIPPSVGGRQMFVAHPEVTGYLRQENASFLFERTPGLATNTDRAQFVARMNEIADVQLQATLGRLARGLPVYDVWFEGKLRAE